MEERGLKYCKTLHLMATQPVLHHGKKLQKKMDDFQSFMASVLTGHSYQVTP